MKMALGANVGKGICRLFVRIILLNGIITVNHCNYFYIMFFILIISLNALKHHVKWCMHTYIIGNRSIMSCIRQIYQIVEIIHDS